MSEPPSTFNGLHSCKPGNDPKQGEVKTFIVQQMTSKKGKPYLKIKAASPESGGTPYRVLSVDPTDYVDAYGNHSFNIEIEPAISSGGGPEAREPDKSTPPTQERPAQASGTPPARQNGKSMEEYAAYATRLFGASWIEAGKWIETAFPKKDAEEMSVRDFYDFKLRVAMHNAIETGRIIRKERF